MPRGIPKAKAQPQSQPASDIVSAPPLILLQPVLDGVQFTAYGLQLPEIVELLRLSMVHVVAKQNGATVIDDYVARSTRVATHRSPAKALPAFDPAKALPAVDHEE
jgi:hypothetical protein